MIFYFLCAFVWLCQCADKVVFDYAKTVRLTLQVVSWVGLNQGKQEPWGECVWRDARRHERDPGQQLQKKRSKDTEWLFKKTLSSSHYKFKLEL